MQEVLLMYKILKIKFIKFNLIKNLSSINKIYHIKNILLKIFF